MACSPCYTEVLGQVRRQLCTCWKCNIIGSNLIQARKFRNSSRFPFGKRGLGSTTLVYMIYFICWAFFFNFQSEYNNNEENVLDNDHETNWYLKIYIQEEIYMYNTVIVEKKSREFQRFVVCSKKHIFVGLHCKPYEMDQTNVIPIP